MERLPAEVRDRIEALAPGAGRLLVAVSGGADSVALLRLVEQAGFELVVGHFDHALRSASAADAEFVRRLCRERGLTCVVGRGEVAAVAGRRGWNLEDAARRLRYDFLTRTAKERGCSGIMTAHTRDDQAETVLMQLLRGAAHLTGIPARRRHLVRPLLTTTRWELREYLVALGQPFREDPSNRDTSRTRAWLRHQVLPLLTERYPRLPEILSRLAILQRDQEAFLRERAAALTEEGGIPLGRWRRRHPALQREALALLLEEAGVAPSYRLIEELRALTVHDRPVRRILPKGKIFRSAYGNLMVVARPPAALPVTKVSSPRDLPAGVPSWVLERFPNLELRSRRPGDRIRLRGGGKKLSDLLIDHKVPREERDALPVLASGGNVLWVSGLAAAVGLPPPQEEDRYFMRRTLRRAEAAAAAGEVPVGALVLLDGEVLAAAHNRTEALHDPTAHAEMLALRAAAARLGDWRLAGATLYVTLEPCPMCLGAVLQTQLARLVFAAYNHREGALGSVWDLGGAPGRRRLEVKGGFMEAEASRLLREFFRGRPQG